MDTIFCILLSFSAITSPGTYHTSQIDSFETVYSLQINNIENNLPMLDMILAEYEPEVPSIVIIDDTSLR